MFLDLSISIFTLKGSGSWPKGRWFPIGVRHAMFQAWARPRLLFPYLLASATPLFTGKIDLPAEREGAEPPFSLRRIDLQAKRFGR